MPWLILFTCLLVGVQPTVSSYLRRRHGDEVPDPSRTSMSPVTTFFAAADRRVRRLLRRRLRRDDGGGPRVRHSTWSCASSTRSRPSPCSPRTSWPRVIFLVVAELDWRAIVLLAAGSVVGGYVGSHVGRRLPADPAARRSW